MYSDERNIYQTARKAAGITQEHGAELLALSVESVRAYESGSRLPSDDVVVRMMDVYDNQLLGAQHLRSASALGRCIIPELKASDISTAVLKLQKELNDFMKLRDDVLDITCDGLIDATESERWQRVLQELDEVAQAIMIVKFAKGASDG
ncbi:MAG: helix-turn-helix transcriptional regulator [Oscillospiraceae bacterium]